MRYSIYFFAMNAAEVAAKLAQPNALLDQLAERIREANQFSEEEVQDSLELASQICAGRLPQDCEGGYFNALCWLCEVASEKVEVPGFVHIRSGSFIDDIGVWPWFQKEPPPFPVPVCSHPAPEVGFLACSVIESVVLHGLADLPECSDAEADSARTHFHEVVESIHEDRLDILAVILCK